MEENVSWNFDSHFLKINKNQRVTENFPIPLSSNSVLEEVIEVRIMLLQLKTLIELVSRILNQLSLHIVMCEM